MDRDIYGQHGVTSLIIFIGINDIGTRLEARKKGAAYASADDIIGGLQQIATDARRRGLKVIGATITPYAGAGFYWSEDGEMDRQVVNNWIRSSKCFDAVIDFDAVLRDPKFPDRLAASFDSGDHLHPSVEGYAQMARTVDLALFAPVPANTKHPVSGETTP
jgi:lysophospholipase L1-like esterase